MSTDIRSGFARAHAGLLTRPAHAPDCGALRTLVAGKRVLVTGAGGFIGAELVRQLSDLKPKRITLLENSEFLLYAIDRELGEQHPALSRCDAYCDVRDRALVFRWFAEERPDIIFHAAAMKHVPLVEAHPLEGVRTNVLGTRNVADAAIRCGAEAMILISTDKAVNPFNVMGATKRLAETYCQALDENNGDTRFVTVRFGNVLGSTGSVVPLFEHQLAIGAPLTITHPDMVRYFMTVDEAARLVLHASVLGSQPEAQRGAIYVLDLGEPIKIVELAHRMIAQAGKRPGIDVKIKFIGLRAGEKLREDLTHPLENLAPTAATGVWLVGPRTSGLSNLRQHIDELADAAAALDDSLVLRLLHAAVPEFVQQCDPHEMVS